MFKVVKLIFLFLFLGPLFVSASSLDKLRALPGGEKVNLLKKESQAKFYELRKKLNTSHLKIPQLERLKTLALKDNRSKVASSSDFMRTIQRSFVPKLRDEMKYGRVQNVDPSLMWHKVSEKQNQYLGDILLHLLSEWETTKKTTVNDLLLSYHSQMVSQTQSENRVNCSEITKKVSPRVDNSFKEAAQIIENYLSIEPSILNKLGNLIRVEVLDGHIVRLRFSDCLLVTLNDEIRLVDEGQIMVNLSSLISIYTGYDDLFILLQKQLLRIVEGKILSLEKLNKDKTKSLVFIEWGGLTKDESNQLNIFNEIKTHMTAKLNGAIDFNAKMKTLTQEELSRLIDLMLQLMSPEIPTENDIVFLRDTLEILSHSSQLNKQGKINGFDIQDIRWAYTFNNDLYQDIYTFENFLKEKKENRRFVDQLRQELIDGE